MTAFVTIDGSDTPNQGRVKINSNFDLVNTELNKKLNLDGSSLPTANINLNGYRIINAGAGLSANEYTTKIQMESSVNQTIVKRYIYVIPETNQPQKILYVDGTNSDYGVKTNRPDTAFNYIQTQADGTTGNEWTIKVPYKASFYKDQSFAKFGNYINMFGEGRPVIEITDSTTVGVADILGISKISGCTLIYKDGVELNIGNGLKIDDCDIFMNNTSYVSPRILTIRSGVVTNCRIFADQIILDSTTGNFVDDCKISVEFTNPQNNDVNTTNKVVSTLANYFDQHSSI